MYIIYVFVGEGREAIKNEKLPSMQTEKKDNRKFITSMSSLYLSRGAFMISRRVKFSESKSKVCPVNLAILSQCLSFMALFAINSRRGQDSLKSSIFFFNSKKACHSFNPFGSLRHLVMKQSLSTRKSVHGTRMPPPIVFTL